MHRSREKAVELLKTVGLYSTQSRVEILQVMYEKGRPMSKKQIAGELGGKFNKTTIYRTLDSFSKAGIIHKAYIERRASYFEAAKDCGHICCHPHFICKRCGRMDCLKEVKVPAIEGLEGYSVSRQQIRLEGLCPDCLKAKNAG